MGPSTPPYICCHDLSELRQAFSLFDKDENGSITTEELSQVMKSMGKSHSDVEIQEMVDEFDADSKHKTRAVLKKVLMKRIIIMY